MTTYTQTYCDICDRDDVGTWQGVCADCWRESLEPDAPNADMPRMVAGRANGMDGGHDYCQACAQIEEG